MTTDELATEAQAALTLLRPCFSGTVTLRFGGVWGVLEKAEGRYTLYLTDVDAPIDSGRLEAYARAFGVTTAEHVQTGYTATLAWEVEE
jgi:hypothetical protein